MSPRASRLCATCGAGRLRKAPHCYACDRTRQYRAGQRRRQAAFAARVVARHVRGIRRTV